MLIDELEADARGPGSDHEGTVRQVGVALYVRYFLISQLENHIHTGLVVEGMQSLTYQALVEPHYRAVDE